MKTSYLLQYNRSYVGECFHGNLPTADFSDGLTPPRLQNIAKITAIEGAVLAIYIRHSYYRSLTRQQNHCFVDFFGDKIAYAATSTPTQWRTTFE